MKIRWDRRDGFTVGIAIDHSPWIGISPRGNYGSYQWRHAAVLYDGRRNEVASVYRWTMRGAMKAGEGLLRGFVNPYDSTHGENDGVSCWECRHVRTPYGPWCGHRREMVPGPGGRWSYTPCCEKNEKGDCSDYRPKWWKFWNRDTSAR